MSRWPDFLIVGAGRAGTTSLYYYLKNHPDIFMPSSKEPHFFGKIDAPSPELARRERNHSSVKVFDNETDYLKLFTRAAAHQLIGEASTTYLASRAAAHRIREKNPRAKIIMVLREPIDHAHSAYLLEVREGKERDLMFYEALQVDYEFEIKYSGEGSYYIQSGLYYQQVKRYLDEFGPEQVRIYLYDDLVRDTAGLVEDICSFLGVSFYDGNFFNAEEKVHTYGAPRNALFRWVGRSRLLRTVAASLAPMHVVMRLRDHLVNHEAAKPPLDLTAKEFLRPIFHDDILKLQELIGRDLGGWLGSDTGRKSSGNG